MATITGVIAIPNLVTGKGITVSFIPLDTPLAVGSQIIATAPVAVITSSAGALPAALTLAAGNYTVKLSAHEKDYGSFNILVPSGSSTYDIIDIVVAAATPGAQPYVVIERDDGQLIKLEAFLVNGTTELRVSNFP